MSFQSLMLKMMVKLPRKWLVKMSGGEPITDGDRTLDPVLQLMTHSARKNPSITTLPPEQARAGSDAGFALLDAKADPSVTLKDFSISTTGGHQIPVRLYTPADQDPSLPPIAWFHMGGGVIGNIETSNTFCALLAKTVRAPVLSVEYRLAPEHPFPAGLNDCETAYEWCLRNGEELGCPGGVAAVAGDSMGGNFAAIIAQEAKRNGIPKPLLQLLIYPCTDVFAETESRTTQGHAYPLSQEIMLWFMDHYLPEDQDPRNVRVSPASEMDLTQLSPALIYAAGFDPLRDEAALYAQRLNQAGGDASYHCFDSLCHAFTAMGGISKACAAANQRIAEDTRAAMVRWAAKL